MKSFVHIGKLASQAGWIGINLFVGLLTVVSAYCGYIPPEKFAFAQVVNMLFPGFITLSFALLLADLFIYKKSALIAFMGILLCTGPLLDIFPLNFKKKALTYNEEQRAFSVLTYNVFDFYDNQGEEPEWGNRSLSYILSTDADIVCLQEGGSIAGLKHVGSSAQRDTLRHRYPFRVEAPANAGEMLFSKFPAERIPTPQPEWGTGKYTAYRLEVEDHQLLLINCHLQSIGLSPDDKAVYRELTDKDLKPTRRELSQVKYDLLPKLSNAFRKRGEQVRHIKSFIDSIGAENVVLVGDFNDVAGSYAYRTIRKAGLKDAYAQCAFGPTITYNTSRFYFHIDQVFYKGDLRPVSITRGKTKSSDHYPMLTTFLWNSVQETDIKSN